MKEQTGVSLKKTITIILLLFVAGSVVFLVAKELGTRTAQEEKKVPRSTEKSVDSQKKKDRLNLYYFHTSNRCVSCYKIENYTKNTIRDVFEKRLEDGTIVFREINIDKPEHKHFIRDFKLHTKSVIVEQIKNGKQVTWENLDKVWQLLNSEAEFSHYIQTELEKHLKKAEL